MTQMPPDLFKCPFCPCITATEKDLNTHIAAFGTDPATHFAKYKKTHRDLEWGYSDYE